MIRKFQNAPVQFVILTAILSIALTTILTSVLSNRHINKINSDITSLSANAQKFQEGAGEMRYIVVNTQRLAIIAMLERNQETLLKAPAQSVSFYEVVDNMIRMLGEENTELTKRVEALKDGYRDFLFSVIGLAAEYVERTENEETALDQVNFQAQQFLTELNTVARNISDLSKKQVHQIEDYADTMRWINTGSMGAILSAILVALFFAEFKFFRPLARLMKFVRDISISKNNLSKRIDICSNDEIGVLGSSINSMLDNLKKTTVSMDELKREVEERKRAEDALTSVKDALEEEVLRRTQELRTSYEELKSEVLERKQAEEKNDQLQAQLLGTRKMEAIGRLAGGLAHDFNNILTGIVMSSELASLKIDKKNHVEKQLRLIQEFGERGALLIKQLLTFSRQQVVQPVSLNVNNLVTGMLKMLCRLIGENIRLTFQRKEKIQPINADPGQIEQILMNLVVNARDAINMNDERQTGGEIHIETRMIQLTNEPILITSGIRAGVYVQLSVSDTGRGMDQETQARIFEPFFTTKPFGKGTGLGLSTVYGIVKNCKGAIDIESELHKGARIKVLFPAISNAEETELKTNVSNMESSGHHSRGIPLRIMLLEDDDSVRRSIQFALQKMGHSVIAYSDPIEAEKKFHEVSETLDLLVSDVIMPGCDGPELYSRFLKHSPLLKVLFISGYADHHIPRRLVHNGQTHFLQKPFKMKQLGKAIDQVIHGRKEEKKKSVDLQEEMRMAV